MWFLNPGRDAIYAIARRFLEPYIENLDLSKFQAGLWAGQLTISNLTLKRSALDKFRLPVDVIEGMSVMRSSFVPSRKIESSNIYYLF